MLLRYTVNVNNASLLFTEVDHTPTPLLHRTLSNTETSSFFSSWSQEINRRNNAGKMLRQDSRLSVKSLIESIENAHKQAKTGNYFLHIG